MNKNKIKYILFAFLLAFVGSFLPGYSLADDPANETAPCSAEKIKEIEQHLNKAAKEGLKNSKTLLDSYNKIVEQYKSSCNPDITTGTPVYWSQDAYQMAYTKDVELADNLMKDKSQYQYTGVVWSAQTVANRNNVVNCNTLRNQANEALQNFNRSRVTTTNMLGRAGGKQVPKTCICSENADNQECIAYATEKEEPKETKDGCPTFNEYLAELTSCPLCVIFEVILNTDSAIAHIAWEKFSGPLQGVVSVFFLVFIALETLKLISSMAGAGTSSYLKSLFSLGLKVAITLILLQNSSYIYGYFITPVIKGGLQMGQEFLNVAASGAGACQIGSSSAFGSIEGNELDSSVLSSMLDTIRCFNNSSLIMPSIGRALMCHGWENTVSILKISFPLPDFEMWLVGAITYLFGLIIWFSVTFYLIDCTVQLGMVCGFVPLFVACWPFEMTKRYTFTGVKMIMNTFFTFVLMGVVMLVGMEIVSFAMSGGPNEGDLYTKITLLNTANVNMKKLKKLVDLDGEEILILIACCIMAMKMLTIATTAAGKFSSGSGMNIGGKMGGMVGSAGQKLTMGAAGAAWIAGKATLGAAGGYLAKNTDVGRSVANRYHKLKANVRQFGRDINRTFTEEIPSAIGADMGLEQFQPQREVGMPTNKEASRRSGNQPNNFDGEKPENKTNNKINPEHQKLIKDANDKFNASDQGKALQDNIDKAKDDYLKAVEEHGKDSKEAHDARDKLRNAVHERRDAKHNAVNSYLDENSQSPGAHGSYLGQMNIEDKAQHDRIAQAKQEVEGDAYMKSMDKNISDTENWNDTLDRAHQNNPELAQAIEQSTGGTIGHLSQEEINRRISSAKHAKDMHMLHEMQNKLSNSDFERFLTSYQAGENF